MKLNVCDICLSEGKLVKAIGYFRVKGYQGLRLDFCASCKKKIPKDGVKYEKYAKKVLMSG